MDLLDVFEGAQTVLVVFGGFPLGFVDLIDPGLALVYGFNNGFFELFDGGEFKGQGCDIGIKFFNLLV